MEPSYLEKSVREAAQLPLNDAAYLLWSRKWSLDRIENPPTPTTTLPDAMNPEIFEKTVKPLMARVMAKARFETDNAEFGSTFSRLKTAHPKASDEDIRRAIRLAVKLKRECIKHHSYGNDYTGDVWKAIETARKGNPDFIFLKETYSAIFRDMCRELR